jgi:hypothetical protein
MVLNLQVNHTVDGVPPGSQATQFGSGQMMANIDSYLQEQAAKIGLEAAQNNVMGSFVKGLGLGHEPKALALTVPAHGMGQVSEELGQPNVSSASIAASAEVQQDLGIKQ